MTPQLPPAAPWLKRADESADEWLSFWVWLGVRDPIALNEELAERHDWARRAEQFDRIIRERRAPRDARTVIAETHVDLLALAHEVIARTLERVQAGDQRVSVRDAIAALAYLRGDIAPRESTSTIDIDNLSLETRRELLRAMGPG